MSYAVIVENDESQWADAEDARKAKLSSSSGKVRT